LIKGAASPPYEGLPLPCRGGGKKSLAGVHIGSKIAIVLDI